MEMEGRGVGKQSQLLVCEDLGCGGPGTSPSTSHQGEAGGLVPPAENGPLSSLGSGQPAPVGPARKSRDWLEAWGESQEQ